MGEPADCHPADSPPERDDMKIYWIGLDTPGRLGISRKPDGGEALDEQMARLADRRIDHVVSLLEPAEAAELGLADEGGAAERNGVGFYNFPITDHGVPADPVYYRRVATAIERRLSAGQTIVIH